jgi:starch phosphorylase
MVQEYAERAYLPAHHAGLALAAEGYAGARASAAWRARVTTAWSSVRLSTAEAASRNGLRVGDAVRVEVRGQLAPLTPADVAVEIRFGPLNADGEMREGATVPARHVGNSGGEELFVAELPLRRSGRLGYAARVVARHPLVPTSFGPVPVVWE